MIKCYCGGQLNLDLEETKKNGIVPVYNCSSCDNLLTLEVAGKKDRGWRTKQCINNKDIMRNIKF